MSKRLMAAAIVLSLAAPTVAAARGSDEQYCSALRDSYAKYAYLRGSRGAKQGIPANVGVAMTRCDTSDVTWAIAQLEQALRNVGLDLPSRG